MFGPQWKACWSRPTASKRKRVSRFVRSSTSPGVGTIAGCYVTEGKVTRGNMVRLLRDQVVVHEGKLASLKRFRDDVREVAGEL